MPRSDRPTHAGPDLAEGPQWQVVIGPGVVRVQGRDFAAAERTWERQHRGHVVETDAFALWAAEERERTWEMEWEVIDGDLVIPPVPDCPQPPRGHPHAPITEWSAKSQSHMQETFASLDFTTMFGRYAVCQAKRTTEYGRVMSCGKVHAPELDRCPACGEDERQVLDKTDRLPAIVTTTYPGDWLPVAPCSEAVKAHHASLAKRFERAWGESWVAIWKLEFQRREAPHFHDFLTPPTGRIDLEVADRTAAVLEASPDTRAQLCQTRHVRKAGADWSAVSVDFEGWLSIVWAEIVDHPDDEHYRRHLLAGTGVDRFKAMSFHDPRRVAAYFAGYSRSKDKSYQNRPPRAWTEGHAECAACSEVYVGDLGECPDCGSRETNGRVEPGGPGRYWGHRGLRRARIAVDVDAETATKVARTLRKWHRAEHVKRATAARGAAAADIRKAGGSVEQARAAGDRAYRDRLTKVVRRPRARRGRPRVEVANYEWREVEVVDMDVYRDTLGEAGEVHFAARRRLVRHDVHDVLGVAGVAFLEGYAPQRRRTRVRRRPITQDGRGRALLNDAPAFVAKLGDWLSGRGPTAEECRERLAATRRPISDEDQHRQDQMIHVSAAGAVRS